MMDRRSFLRLGSLFVGAAAVAPALLVEPRKVMVQVPRSYGDGFAPQSGTGLALMEQYARDRHEALAKSFDGVRVEVSAYLREGIAYDFTRECGPLVVSPQDYARLQRELGVDGADHGMAIMQSDGVARDVEPSIFPETMELWRGQEGSSSLFKIGSSDLTFSTAGLQAWLHART